MVEPLIARRAAVSLALLAALAACRKAPDKPATIRLVDAFDVKFVEGSPAASAATARRTEWRFDGPPPSAPPAPPPAAGRASLAAAVSGHARLGTRPRGRSPGAAGRPTGGPEHQRDADTPRRADDRAGQRGPGARGRGPDARLQRRQPVRHDPRRSPTVDLKTELRQVQALPWLITSPIVAGDQMQTYTITPPAPIAGSRVRHLLLRPDGRRGRGLRDRIGTPGVPPGAPGQRALGGELAGVARHLPRDAGHARARSRALRGGRAGAAGHARRARHPRGRAGDLQDRGAAGRQGRAGADAHADHAVPVGAARAGPERLRGCPRNGVPFDDGVETGHHRLLGRARDPPARGR